MSPSRFALVACILLAACSSGPDAPDAGDVDAGTCATGAARVSGLCACDTGLAGDPIVGGCFATCALSGTCTTGEACVDGAAGSTCAACPPGYASDGAGDTSCADVDECAAGTDTCAADEACANTDSSFTCTPLPLLSNLTASAGRFTFEPGTTDYAFDVGFSRATITLTPVALAGTTVSVNGAAASSGEPSAPIALDLGANTISVVATDGDRVATYSLAITRAAGVTQAYLKASNAEKDDFVRSVAVSGDTMVVGAAGEDGSAASTAAAPNNLLKLSGAAYVFERSGSTWTQTAYLKAANAGAGGKFGTAVAIDNDTVVVSAEGEDGSAASTAGVPDNLADQAGAAYVFERSGGVWTQIAYLKAGNAESWDRFGDSVAVSGDTVVVGAAHENGSAASTAAAPDNLVDDSGAAYVFERSGSTWTQTAYLKASIPGAYDLFGMSVDVSGGTVVVGSIRDLASVFERAGSTWARTADLKAANDEEEEGDWFGKAVAISGDTVVVGAAFEDGSAVSTAASPDELGLHAGAAYVFERSGGLWTQVAYLKAGNAEPYDWFGESVDISGDRLVVGAPQEDGSATSTSAAPDNFWNEAGAAYVFERSGSTWKQTAYLKAGNGQRDDQFGAVVAISGDTVAVNAPVEGGSKASTAASPDNLAPNSGAVYAFEL